MSTAYTQNITIYPAIEGRNATAYDGKTFLPSLLPIQEYNKIIVLFSGGKDSLAALLHLLEMGVPRERLELWHHDIDGGNTARRMDWPVTQQYVQAVADALGIKLRVSWRKGGFWDEVYRLGASKPVYYTDNNEVLPVPKSRAQLECDALRKAEQTPEVLEALKAHGHRMKFPAKSASLMTRWCSSSLKIMVADAVLRNLEELNTGDNKILLVSGERREESASRSKLNEIEVHRTNATAKARRLVHQWRCVIDWPESKVWEIIQRHSIVPHPCYYAGWNRCSCAMCIFGLPRHWAGIREIMPDDFNTVVAAEQELGFSLDNNKMLLEYVGGAESCVVWDYPEMVHKLVQQECSVEDVFTDTWILPAGAYQGAKGGPC